MEGCQAEDYHLRERLGTWEYAPHSGDLEKHSAYEVAIFDDVFTATSDKFYIQDRESCHAKLQRCQYSLGGGCQRTTTLLDKHLRINMNLEKKADDSILASWVASNIAFKLRTKTKDYLDGTASFAGYSLGGPDVGDYLDPCRWDGAETYRDWITFYCLHGLAEMPMDYWDAMGNESYSSPGMYKVLMRESHDDDSSLVDVNEYIIDGKITLDSVGIDKLYYLDDRATDDNQGVIAASKGNSDEKLSDTEYIPDSWDINWKIDWNKDDRTLQGCATSDDNIEYIDIKDKLLEALDCEIHELFDIGLV